MACWLFLQILCHHNSEYIPILGATVVQWLGCIQFHSEEELKNWPGLPRQPSLNLILGNEDAWRGIDHISHWVSIDLYKHGWHHMPNTSTGVERVLDLTYVLLLSTDLTYIRLLSTDLTYILLLSNDKEQYFFKSHLCKIQQNGI